MRDQYSTMTTPLDPNKQFPVGRQNDLNTIILGKVMSFASIEDDPSIPDALKAEYAAEKDNVEVADRNMKANEGNPMMVRLYRNAKRESLRALEDINRRATNIRLGTNWV